jgi:hypothetical protein
VVQGIDEVEGEISPLRQIAGRYWVVLGEAEVAGQASQRWPGAPIWNALEHILLSVMG